MFIQSFPRVYQSATFQASRLPSICTFETVENFNNSLTPSWRCTQPGVLQKIKKCLPSECNVSSIFEASPLIKSVIRVLRSVPTRLSICYEGYAYNLRKVNMFIHCDTEASLLSFTRVMPLLIIHCAMFAFVFLSCQENLSRFAHRKRFYFQGCRSYSASSVLSCFGSNRMAFYFILFLWLSRISYQFLQRICNGAARRNVASSKRPILVDQKSESAKNRVFAPRGTQRTNGWANLIFP